MDLKPVFDSFYDKLILRDLFANIIPGLLFMFSLVAGLLGIDALSQLLAKMSWFLGIMALGIAWLLGFSLEYIGEASGVLRKLPRGKEPSQTRDSFFKKWAAFQDQASITERIHAERLNIIEDACGHTAVSLVCSMVFMAWGACIRETTIWPFVPYFIIGLILAISFWQTYIINIEMYGSFVEDTLAYRKAATSDLNDTIGKAPNQRIQDDATVRP